MPFVDCRRIFATSRAELRHVVRPTEIVFHDVRAAVAAIVISTV
jgi:hypothetical protein